MQSITSASTARGCLRTSAILINISFISRITYHRNQDVFEPWWFLIVVRPARHQGWSSLVASGHSRRLPLLYIARCLRNSFVSPRSLWRIKRGLRERLKCTDSGGHGRWKEWLNSSIHYSVLWVLSRRCTGYDGQGESTNRELRSTARLWYFGSVGCACFRPGFGARSRA